MLWISTGPSGQLVPIRVCCLSSAQHHRVESAQCVLSASAAHQATIAASDCFSHREKPGCGLFSRNSVWRCGPPIERTKVAWL